MVVIVIRKFTGLILRAFCNVLSPNAGGDEKPAVYPEFHFDFCYWLFNS